MSIDTIAIEPLAPSLGARIDGVDLTALDDETFATIHQAFLDRHVIGIALDESDAKQAG